MQGVFVILWVSSLPMLIRHTAHVLWVCAVGSLNFTFGEIPNIYEFGSGTPSLTIRTPRVRIWKIPCVAGSFRYFVGLFAPDANSPYSSRTVRLCGWLNIAFGDIADIKHPEPRRAFVSEEVLAIARASLSYRCSVPKVDC